MNLLSKSEYILYNLGYGGFIMFCQYCGNELKNDSKFCPSCGAKLSEESGRTGYSDNRSNYSDNKSTSFQGNDSLAIVGYITWIGFFIALIMNREENNDFVNFHLNQALLLNIGFLTSAIPVIGWIISVILFIFWVMAVVSAAQKKMTPLPIIGDIHIIN